MSRKFRRDGNSTAMPAVVGHVAWAVSEEDAVCQSVGATAGGLRPPRNPVADRTAATAAAAKHAY